MRRFALSFVTATALAAGILSAPGIAAADPLTPMVDVAACSANSLAANYDSSAEAITLPFDLDFYTRTYNTLWVNNNGNVTFDGPLSTFTPFGLVGTNAAIIAPFFADVDTRASGAVTYGWGTTTYQGHRAFCATWKDVGYFNNHSDKTNSFQLLLVEREDSKPGAFDIVFNYESVQWETGDASGGSGGLGGSVARAGFSNGTGAENASYELVGSGESGAFLDSDPRGLAHRTTQSATPGRFVWQVRGSAPIAEYVALGDSYQSGEGSFDYYWGTDIPDRNLCHRSVNAYPVLLGRDGAVEDKLAFWACSGATIPDLYSGAVSTSGPVWDDPMRALHDESVPTQLDQRASQMDRLSDRTRLVTVGVGGNDMQFVPVLADCISTNLLNWDPAASCATANKKKERDILADLVEDGAWTNLIDDIRASAPYARIIMLGYPKFYAPVDPTKRDACGTVRPVDRDWINTMIDELNDEIEKSANSRGIAYADIYGASKGIELCTDAAEPFMNGFIPALNAAHAESESYHPTDAGHRRIADILENVLSESDPGTVTRVGQGQHYSLGSSVTGQGGDASFSTSWPGSDVVMTLTSPSGRVIDRSTVAPDVQHQAGPTSELYVVSDPEAGEWTVDLYGAQVAPEGEDTRFVAYQEPVANATPTAAVALTQAGYTVTASAAGSTDVDGTIVDYLWDFGDGYTATGVTATHRYEAPGDFLVTVSVTDDRGAKDFTSAAGVTRVLTDIAYSATSGANVDIWTSQPDGTSPRRLTTHSGIDASPAWSPDRSKIAFSSTRTGSGDIYTMNSDGSGVVRLTTSVGVDGSPSWSPDGARIVFSSVVGGNSDIYSMMADGTGLARLTTHTAIDASPDWSPDGSRIVFSSSRTGSSDIYSMKADGTDVRRITATAAIDADPAWSPDGSRIAYTSIASLNIDVYTIGADGTGVRRVTTNAGIDASPTWAPDGSRLLYSSTRGLQVDLYSSAPDGAGPARVTTAQGIEATPAWR
jgi:Tol biopolymer transport system component/lysophospholipase L1-like esterase